MATEKRLIDANDALKRLQKAEKEMMVVSVVGCKAVPIDGVIEFIQTRPTVEAVELPCKIGDKVYRIDKGDYHSNYKPFVQELTVTEISWKQEKYRGKDLGFAIIANGIRYKFTSIGKSVFLSREEAEAKMDGDGNGT